MRTKPIVNPTLRNPLSKGIKPVWNSKCKVLLLGSITAIDGMNKGFYYSSQKNQLWTLLDYALNLNPENKNSFTYLKSLLKQNYDNFFNEQITLQQFENSKQLIIEKFAKKLLSYKIAMCDVFKECYFNNNSSLDNEIILNNPNYPFITNKETISEIINDSMVTTVVVNSKFVLEQFKKLNINGNYEIKYVISPSPRRGAISTKVNNWKEVFNNFSLKND